MMRVRLTTLIIALAIVSAGTIFFAGKPELSSAQDGGFKMYQLLVFCGNSGLASAIFGHTVAQGGTVGRPLMGTKSICVGNCGGGGTVSLEDALAGLPAEVSAALKAKVDKHQEDAAAGKGRRLTCLGDEKNKPKDKEDCEKPTPWFGPPPSGCKDVQSPQVTQNQATVTLSLCGYPIWIVRSAWGGTGKPDIEGATESRAALTERVRSQLGSRICCDNFREAVRTGVPCDPRADLDCDGKPNREDTRYPQRYVSPRDNETYSYSGSLPDINIFSRAVGASIDPFPPGLDPDDTEFFPPQDKCDCKWELKKGTLNCSPDGRQPHHYQASWRCPSTGNERFTRKSAPATAPCTPA